MPWISLHDLKTRIMQKLLAEHGTLNDMTPFALDGIVNTFPRREKRDCGCAEPDDCDCVLFGLAYDYSRTYEYYVEESNEKN